MNSPSPKEQGMSEAVVGHEDDLAKARKIAHSIGLALGKCSINDVRRVWPGEFPSGNWVGSIFKDGCWERVGFTSAKHSESHSHAVSVWRFKGSRVGTSVRKAAVSLGDAPAAPTLGFQSDLFQGAA